MNYEEFIKLIPEETKKYLSVVLKCLNYFHNKTNIYRHDSTSAGVKEYNVYNRYNSSNEMIKNQQIQLSTLIGLSFDKKYSFLNTFGLDPQNIKLDDFVFSETPLNENAAEQVFNSYSGIFLIHSDKTKYTTLLPIDIVVNALKTLNGSNSLFKYLDINDKIEYSVKKLSEEEHTKLNLEQEKVYEQLPIEVINYIETATKIRSLLINSLSENNLKENEYIKKDDNYLVPLSLLISIYEYDIEKQNIIKKYLTDKGMSLKELYANIFQLKDWETANLTSKIELTERNMESLKPLYKKYWHQGINKDKQSKDIQVLDIVTNLLDRNFTQSIVIEKILNDFKIDITESLPKQIEEFKNIYESKEINEQTKEFYSKISKDAKEFINFSCKTYQVLLEQMKQGNQNKDFLVMEDDADTLAIFIASHYYQTDLDKFYNSYDVTFDKILKLLNITITKEEIEKMPLDRNLLIKKFERYVLKGVNANKLYESVTINDIVRNLCNRDFNKSMIMENIFEEIRRDINLPNDFLSNLDSFIGTQERERIRQEKEEYFKNLPLEDIDYLTSVCEIYSGFNNKDRYDDELIVVLSLIIALLYLESPLNEYFTNLGIDEIEDYFNVRFKNKGSLNIDLLKEKFNKYIYEGANKGNPSPDILSIFLNALNGELYKSINLTQFLNSINLNYDTFKNKEQISIEIEQQKLQKEKNKIAQEKLSKSVNSTIISDAVTIYNYLIDFYHENKEKYKEIKDDNDLATLSIIRSILCQDYINQTKILIKHNLTEQNILNFLNLPHDYKALPRTKDSDNTLANVFYSYLESPNDSIFEILTKQDFYKRLVEHFVENPKVLEIELKTGKEYEETLTIDQRIKLIQETPVEPLDISNMSTVFKFSSSLSLHTTYIQDEFPKLMSSNEIENATGEIKSLISKVYTETESPKPKSLLQRLFGTPSEIEKEVNINTDIVNSLKPNIDTQIEKLHAEGKKLTELKAYMEEYRKKNQEYIEVVTEFLQKLKEKLSKLDNQDPFEISDYNSYITILESKLETLKTTDILIKQEYIKINQVIVNHYITINSLIMSRNTLLPLIGSEMMIGNGIISEKEGMDTTKQLLDLLNDIISKDTQGTKEVLEKLKDTNLSEEKLLLLTKTVDEQIDYNKVLESTNTPPVLTLEVDTTNQDNQPKTLVKRQNTTTTNNIY